MWSVDDAREVPDVAGPVEYVHAGDDFLRDVVAGWYRASRLDLLERHLRDIGCPAADVRVAMSIFEAWAARDGLVGLPVGLDSSSVLGTSFLRDVDIELEQRGIVHGRWVDDIA